MLPENETKDDRTTIQKLSSEILGHIFYLLAEDFPIERRRRRQRTNHGLEVIFLLPRALRSNSESFGTVSVKKEAYLASRVCRTWHEVVCSDPQLHVVYLVTPLTRHDMSIVYQGWKTLLEASKMSDVYIISAGHDIWTPDVNELLKVHGHRLVYIKADVYPCLNIQRLFEQSGRHGQLRLLSLRYRFNDQAPLTKCFSGINVQRLSLFNNPTTDILRLHDSHTRSEVLILTLKPTFGYIPTHNPEDTLSFTLGINLPSRDTLRRLALATLLQPTLFSKLRNITFRHRSLFEIQKILFGMAVDNLERLEINVNLERGDNPTLNVLTLPSLRVLSIIGTYSNGPYQAFRPLTLEVPKLRSFSFKRLIKIKMIIHPASEQEADFIHVHGPPALNEFIFTGPFPALSTALSALKSTKTINRLKLTLKLGEAMVLDNHLTDVWPILESIQSLTIQDWGSQTHAPFFDKLTNLKRLRVNQCVNLLSRSGFLKITPHLSLHLESLEFHGDKMYQNDDRDEEFCNVLLDFLEGRKNDNRSLNSLVFNRIRIKDAPRKRFEKMVDNVQYTW